MSYDEHLISMAGGDGDVLDQIQARADKATAGPWTAQDLETEHGHRGIFWISDLNHGAKTIAEIDANDGGIEAIWSFKDAEFIAHARTDIPALLAMMREQRARLDAVAELANWAGKHGWTLDAAAIRAALEPTK